MYANLEAVAPEEGAGGLAYIRQKWAEFSALSPRIIDLQHRAAGAAYHYKTTGHASQAAAAKRVIEELAKLQQVHHRVVSWWDQAAPALGVGAVQIPIGIAGVSVVALLVAWSFRKFAAQERALQLLEAGVLTPEQFDRLDILDPPGIGEDIASMVGGIGRWVVLGLIGLALLEAVKRGTFRSNPPLILFGNPPGPMSEDVAVIGYKHEEDGEFYAHEFEGGVEMVAEEDGSLSMSHPDHPIWSDF